MENLWMARGQSPREFAIIENGIR